MSQKIASRTIERGDDYFRLRGEVEELFYDEAQCLDERRFSDWLDMLHRDIRYFMPIRRNVPYGEHHERENTVEGEGISWFDEDKWTLEKRVEQIDTGVHYAEEPLSRTAHLITNVQVQAAQPSTGAAEQVETTCRFIVYQNRVEYETNLFVGRRYDTLTRVEGVLKVLHREIILDQNVLLAKNLSTFF
ncbi:MAG: 3-phenylpropionate/cinnamic acid dioxygenase subunit beta [Acidimicrobiales bacterium]